MQETTFPVEIIIRDDASKDGTAEIVREYHEKFPQLIRTILHSENQFSKGKKAFPETYAMARGEFIALCEGDDYWICKEKLERQVEVLDGDQTIVGCCHEILSNIVPNNGLLFGSDFSHIFQGKRVDLNYLLHSNVVGTSSAIFRRKHACFPQEAFEGLAMGDWPMWIFLAKNGSFWINSTPRSFYRVHQGGVWSSANSVKRDFESLKMLSRISVYISKKHEESGVKGIVKYYLPFLIRIFLNGDISYFKSALKEVSNCAWDQDKIQSQLALRLINQNIFGIQGSRFETFRGAWFCSNQLRELFENTKNSDYFAAIAKSIIGQAWACKLKSPFFSLWLILLAMRISILGSFKSLAEMVVLTFRRHVANLQNG